MFRKAFVFLIALLVVNVDASWGEQLVHNNRSEGVKHRVRIPASNAVESLGRLAEQTDAEFIFPYDIAKERQTRAVVGRLTVMGALKKMLKGSGLSSGLSDKGAIRIFLSDGALNNYEGIEMNTKKNILAMAVGSVLAGGVWADDAVEGDELGWLLEEVVVTATRREVSLNDTAISIAVIGGEEISRRNLSEMNDYLRTMPGVSLVEVGVGQNAPIIRGVAINPQSHFESNSPAGVYFGEISLSGVALFGQSADLRMVDLDRVEVLRGPQGTLFGSGALSGAVRNIPNAPRLNEIEGSIKTTYSNTAKNGGGNTKIEGVINVPLIEDKLAIRTVAYQHNSSGFYKNIAATVLADNGFLKPETRVADVVALNGGEELYQNERDVGDVEFSGGRISAFWKPTGAMDITLQYIYQDAEQVGQPYAELYNGGGYNQTTLQLGDGLRGERSGFQSKSRITNLVVEYDRDWVSLMSSSTWMDTDNIKFQDQSPYIANLSSIFENSNKFFSQEIRLVSDLDGPFQYVVGLYYEEIEPTGYRDFAYGATRELVERFGSPFGDSFLILAKTDEKFLEQEAAYAELSYNLTDTLQVSLGARLYDYERVNARISSGLGGLVNSVEETNESGTNLKVGVKYTPNEEILIFSNWAEGFRLGGTNSISPFARNNCDVNNDGVLDGTEAPFRDSFDSDSTQNLEVGAKLTLLENRLQLNATLYRVEWSDIPLFVFSTVCNAGVTVNASEARSQGLEVESTFQVNPQLLVKLGASHNKSELTKDSLAAGEDGDRLASSPEYTVNLGLQYDQELWGYDTFLTVDYARVGSFYNRLDEQGIKGGGYGQLNMSMGTTFSDINIELFAHNLTNEDAITLADTIIPDERVYRLRPRTVGLNIGYRF